MENPNPSESKLTLMVAEDGKHLVAHFEPSPERIDAVSLRKRIAEAGYDDWFLDDQALSKVVEGYNEGSTAGDIEIAERRDGTLELEVSRDKMSAHLTITPPFGGAAVTVEQVLEALQKKRVSAGILEAEIHAAVEKREAEYLLVAEGVRPVDGEDAQFTCLVPDVKDRRPAVVDDSGAVDYRDLGEIKVVNPGDVLMRRVPATAGTPGTDLTGMPVKQTPGENLPYSPKLIGIARSKEDPEVLVAAVYGQPLVVEQGMIVDPTLTMQTVDLSTGNVSFEGAIKVEGDVKPGMKVTAAGDVFVAGLVEAAEIKAGGDIIVAGGVIGHGDPLDEQGKVNRNAAVLEAVGSVSAMFIENACVTAGNEILVKELVRHSELDARNNVIIGKKGAKKGNLMGGETRAGLMVKALTIGAQAGVVTKITVGECRELEAELREKQAKLEEREQQRQKVLAVWNKIQAGEASVTDELREKTRLTLESARQLVQQLGRDIEGLKRKLEARDGARIAADMRMYSNLHLTVRGKFKLVNDERGGGAYYLEGNDIVFGLPRKKK